MASRTPVEIWQKILKYAISVPIFFDYDPISTVGGPSLSQYRMEGDYWRSERIRNSLRRACKAWNDYLRLFDHRYVRLSDVHHERIPASVIPMAIRLYLEPDSSCQCYLYCVGGIGFYPPDMELLQGMNAVLTAAVVEPKGPLSLPMWKIEILDGGIIESDALFALILAKAPSLAAIIDSESRNLSLIQEKTRNLRALYLSYKSGSELRPIIHPLMLRHLTVLRITTFYSSDPTMEYWTGNLVLPSLLHLSILDKGQVTSAPHFRSQLLGIVKNLGCNLLTLYHHGYGKYYTLPDELWAYVPKLERIQILCWKDTCPPANHPVQYVRIHMRDITNAMTRFLDGFSTTLLHYIPRWDGHSSRNTLTSAMIAGRAFTVEMDSSWLSMMTPYIQMATDIALWIVSYYSGSNVRVTDSEGLTFDEYLVFAIKNYWKKGRANRRGKPKLINSPLEF